MVAAPVLTPDSLRPGPGARKRGARGTVERVGGLVGGRLCQEAWRGKGEPVARPYRFGWLMAAGLDRGVGVCRRAR